MNIVQESTTSTANSTEQTLSASVTNSPTHIQRLRWLIPGLTLTIIVSVVAVLLQNAEEVLLGHAVIEALVIAIVLGMAWRTTRGLDPRAVAGVNFAAKPVLEVAIVLLGASVDLPALVQGGWPLLFSVLVTVSAGLTISILLGRALGLKPKLAILVAVGNSICGNSAIAAIAPIIGAEPEDVTSSIALTAVLGVLVVILLPSLIGLFGLSFYQYGILAGLSVYAVPQVVAATFSVSAISGQIGTLVKLVRVLLLGPVALFFSLRYPAAAANKPSLFGTITRFVPWFIIGFILLALLRSIGIMPATIVDPLHTTSTLLTIAAMAALGLSVDV